MQASAVPLPRQGRMGRARVALVAATVEMVSVAVPAAALERVTGLVDPKLSSGSSAEALEGPPAMAAVSVTLPVKPPLGVTVIVEVLPVVAPGAAMVTAVPPTVKLGTMAALTVKLCETGAAAA